MHDRVKSPAELAAALNAARDAKEARLNEAIVAYLMGQLYGDSDTLDGVSIRQVAERHGVNYFTLRNRLGKLAHDTNERQSGTATEKKPRHSTRGEHGRFTPNG